MIYDGQIFLTLPLAQAAIVVAMSTWTPPQYADVGGGRHVQWASLPAQKMTDPIQMEALTWAVIGPGFAGTAINTDLFKHIDIGLGLQAAAAGAESGIVARPGAVEEKTG